MARSILTSPVVDPFADSSAETIGDRAAPITVVEYSDFQCPFCRLGSQTLKAVCDHYGNKVRVIFKNFPLDNSCAKWKGSQQMHPHACAAARAAVCAEKQGLFPGAYEKLFLHQSEFAESGDSKIEELMGNIGLDTRRYENCIGDDNTAEKLAKDIRDGSHLGLNSTPTFYLNGHEIKGLCPLPVWVKMIDQLLVSAN